MVVRPFLRRAKVLAVLIALLVPVSRGLNLGLIAGDNKRHGSPLIIRKVSKLSPVFININSGPNAKTPLSLPKLPPKPPPLKLFEPKSKPSRKVPRSLPLLPPLLLPGLLPPLIPKLPLIPFLPILPPILPPLLPPLPLLPKIRLLPPLPQLPKLKQSLKPLRVPILKKCPLKPLGSELKPVKVPQITVDTKNRALKKLTDLKKKGSLTTAEFIRFKKLLLK